MSFVVAPEFVTAAAGDLANIGSTLSAARSAAAASTTGISAAAADEVSSAIAALFNTHALDFQALGARAAAFHAEFVGLLNGGAAQYLSTEAANAAAIPTAQDVLNQINAPFLQFTGRPLIGNGANGAPGTGAPGGAGGWLLGDGGAGGSG
ncbi:PE family protein, partial [Mycobacterium sp. 1081908.1]|uniref:PE family protein n=1 Tax=Mycobacterium sp. 1081908.1 TaxID=1834066 RepID=UPI000A3F0AD5